MVVLHCHGKDIYFLISSHLPHTLFTIIMHHHQYNFPGVRSQESGEMGNERGGRRKNYPLIFLPYAP
ncbi:MAG: hypothetical protein AAGJ08_25915 [Cyanobacteria bacterium P01_H01_bin.35]